MLTFLSNNSLNGSSWLVDVLSIEIELLELPDDNEVKEKGLDTIHKLRKLIYCKQDNDFRSCIEFNRLMNKYKNELIEILGNNTFH